MTAVRFFVDDPGASTSISSSLCCAEWIGLGVADEVDSWSCVMDMLSSPECGSSPSGDEPL